MEFDLQRFADEDAAQDSAQEISSETQSAEEKPIPEELNGLPEDIARETLAEWEKSQPAPDEKPPEETSPPNEEIISREKYQAALDEAAQLKAQLAQYQQQQAQTPQQPSKPQPQQIQQPQLRITPEISAKINQAIDAEAMALTGFSKEQVAELSYADDDDPRLPQWNLAKNIAQNRVYNAIQQTQLAQQYQAQQFYNNHVAAINTYNEFAKKEFAEPDFKEIQQFATNDFFNQLSPDEQKILANSYVRLERQTASPAEMLVVKTYYERAKAAYRTRGAKKSAPKNTPSAAQLPRSDQLKGTSATGDGQLSVSDFQKLLEGDFTELDPKTQKQMLALL